MMFHEPSSTRLCLFQNIFAKPKPGMQEPHREWRGCVAWSLVMLNAKSQVNPISDLPQCGELNLFFKDFKFGNMATQVDGTAYYCAIQKSRHGFGPRHIPTLMKELDALKERPGKRL